MSALTWKFCEYPKHLFILSDRFDMEWAASAMYLSSFLKTQSREGRVCFPVHWRRFETPDWWDSEFIINPLDIQDHMDQGYRIWFWGVQGKTHWWPLEDLMEDRLRLQIVNYSSRNRWVSDKVVRLPKETGGVCEFILTVAGYQGDLRYFKQALEASEDTEWFSMKLPV